MRRDTSAFTLVEVMVVLFLLGIILAAAIPSMKSTADEMKIDAAAQEVVYAIQYIQSLSIKEGVVYGVKFFPGADSFRCYEKSSGDTIYHPIDKKPYIIDFDGQLQGVDLVSTDLPSSKEEFNSLGEPSSGGSVILGYAGFQKTINVSAVTGMVSVQ